MEPKAIAKVKLPERIPTCPVVNSNPFCQTGIVADNPTIQPDPSIDPIPAAVAKGEYFLTTELFFLFKLKHSISVLSADQLTRQL